MFVRLPRGAIEDGEDLQTLWGEDYWNPGDTQIGTQWVPAKFLGIDLSLTGKRGDVGLIFWIAVIQLCLSVLPVIVSCCQKCCSEEGEGNKRSAVAGSGNSFMTFLIGILGILAVKLDCKELLMTVVIMALISLLLTAIYLLIVICGFGVFCCGAEGCCERIWGLLALIMAVVWILLASFLNILLVIKGWQFCFGEGLSDSVSNIES